MTCANCPHDLYHPVCEHFGFCLNLLHLVPASSNCEAEEGRD